MFWMSTHCTRLHWWRKKTLRRFFLVFWRRFRQATEILRSKSSQSPERRWALSASGTHFEGKGFCTGIPKTPHQELKFGTLLCFLFYSTCWLRTSRRKEAEMYWNVCDQNMKTEAGWIPKQDNDPKHTTVEIFGLFQRKKVKLQSVTWTINLWKELSIGEHRTKLQDFKIS